jgi:ribosomal protein S18 acetylase RimI-like enzyme
LAISYRILEPKDSSDYRRIRLKSLKEHPDCFTAKYEEQVRLEKLYFERQIEINSQEAFMVGAYSEGCLIGICGFLGKSDYFDDAGTIVQMYVLPEWRNKGIGHGLVQLIKDIVTKEKTFTKIVLEVPRTNDSAIHAYEKASFKKVSPSNQVEKPWLMVYETSQS